MSTSNYYPARDDQLVAPGRWSKTYRLTGLAVTASPTDWLVGVGTPESVDLLSASATLRVGDGYSTAIAVDVPANTVTVTSDGPLTMVPAGARRWSGAWVLYHVPTKRTIVGGSFVVDRLGVNEGGTAATSLTVTSTTTTIELVASIPVGNYARTDANNVFAVDGTQRLIGSSDGGTGWIIEGPGGVASFTNGAATWLTTGLASFASISFDPTPGPQNALVAGVFSPTENPAGTIRVIDPVALTDAVNLQTFRAGAVLAVKAHDPGTTTTYSTSSSTLSDIDAANLLVTFVAPPSGNVLVELDARVTTSSAIIPTWGLRDGSGQVGGLCALGNSMNLAGLYQRRTGMVRVTGLTPGTTYSYKWAWKASAASFSMSAGQSAGAEGPAVMRVIAA